MWKSVLCRLLPVALLLIAGTPLSAAPAAEPPQPIDLNDAGPLIARDFVRYDPNYKTNRQARESKLADLARSFVALQEQGHNMSCSHQIYLEAKWLVEYTADWARTDRRLEALAESLKHIGQDAVEEQSPEDGSWGGCFEAWFMKVEATVYHLEELADRGTPPKYPVTFLNRFLQPDALTAYLQRLLVSDIADKGVDNRSELGSITASLTTIFFKKDVAKYARNRVAGLSIDDDTVAAYQSFLDHWEDPATGYWGAWYASDGAIYRAPDLSLTYHQIAYHPDGIDNWPQIIDTTMAIRDRPYPYGWMTHGHFNNHNNYDIVRTLKLAWPHATDAEKQAIRKVIGTMLQWCLDHSLMPDGSFKSDAAFYDSLGARYYYGVSFLDEVGYWNKANRFWTDDTFAKGMSTCCAIKARIHKTGMKGGVMASAIGKLERGCPAC